MHGCYAVPLDLWRVGIAVMLFGIAIAVEVITERVDVDTAGITAFASIIGLILALLGSYKPSSTSRE